jgi:hypothetical protein
MRLNINVDGVSSNDSNVIIAINDNLPTHPFRWNSEKDNAINKAI